ncbi:MAG: hypothetical protein HXY51_02360 [Nitrospirae bacterium]|nr:hypothetical protein [Nitrospirota bacterium]
MTLPNCPASVALQRFESSAASELVSPAFSLREVKTLVHDLFPPKSLVYWSELFLSVFVAYRLAAVYLTTPACASLVAISDQSPIHLWLDAKVEP